MLFLNMNNHNPSIGPLNSNSKVNKEPQWYVGGLQSKCFIKQKVIKLNFRWGLFYTNLLIFYILFTKVGNPPLLSCPCSPTWNMFQLLVSISLSYFCLTTE